jgi:hypothetical protein
MNNDNKTYIGTYKVYKVFRKSARKQVIERGLTLEEAQRLVRSFPNSNRSMVVYTKQFWADKYFI